MTNDERRAFRAWAMSTEPSPYPESVREWQALPEALREDWIRRTDPGPPAGLLDLSLDRALLLASLPECPTCAALTGDDCRWTTPAGRSRPDQRVRVRVHDERLVDLRDEVELYAIAVATERAAARRGLREIEREAAGIRDWLNDGASHLPGRRREVRAELARLRTRVLG